MFSKPHQYQTRQRSGLPVMTRANLGQQYKFIQTSNRPATSAVLANSKQIQDSQGNIHPITDSGELMMFIPVSAAKAGNTHTAGETQIPCEYVNFEPNPSLGHGRTEVVPIVDARMEIPAIEKMRTVGNRRSGGFDGACQYRLRRAETNKEIDGACKDVLKRLVTQVCKTVRKPRWQSELRHIVEANLEQAAGVIEILKDGDLYVCSVCNYPTDRLSFMRRHISSHSGDKQLSCHMCGYQTNLTANLKRHMQRHTGEKPFVCPVCRRRFRQKIHVQNHLKTSHRLQCGIAVKCQYCDYICTSIDPDLVQHMRRDHDGIAGMSLIECEQCGFVATSRYDMKQHKKFHQAGPEIKLFCQQCSFVTSSQSRLKRHLMSHSQEKPFLCPKCDYRGTQKIHVISHVRVHHGIELTPSDVYTTDDAPIEEYTASPEVSAVYRQYQKPNQAGGFTVTVDGGDVEVYGGQDTKILSMQDDEDDIELVVSDNGTISTTTASTQGSAQHQQQQIAGGRKYTTTDYSAADKVFQCTQCPLKFSKLINLYKHLYTQHADIAGDERDQMGNYSCILCAFKSTSKPILLNHMRRHTVMFSGKSGMMEDTVYACTLCHYTTTKQENYVFHLGNEHSMSIMILDNQTIVAMDKSSTSRLEGGADAAVAHDDDEDESIISAQQQLAAMQQQTSGQSVFPKTEEPADNNYYIYLEDLGANVQIPADTVDSLQPGQMVEFQIEDKLYQIPVEMIVQQQSASS